MHSVKGKCTFVLLVHIWAARLRFWVRVCSPSWVLYPGWRAGASSSCTQTSAATSTPAPPSICINLLLHIFRSSHPDIFKVHNCGRGVSTCAPAVPLFTCLHRCTQDTPQLRIPPHKLTHLASQKCTILPETLALSGMCLYDIPQLCISAGLKLFQKRG